MAKHGERRKGRPKLNFTNQPMLTGPWAELAGAGPVWVTCVRITERWCARCRQWIVVEDDTATFCPECQTDW